MQPPLPGVEKKITAGILAILLGSIGIHKFYLAYTSAGIIQIVLSLCTCGIGSLIALAEGIIYLTMSDADFYQSHIVGRKPWF